MISDDVTRLTRLRLFQFACRCSPSPQLKVNQDMIHACPNVIDEPFYVHTEGVRSHQGQVDQPMQPGLAPNQAPAVPQAAGGVPGTGDPDDTASDPRVIFGNVSIFSSTPRQKSALFEIRFVLADPILQPTFASSLVFATSRCSSPS